MKNDIMNKKAIFDLEVGIDVAKNELSARFGKSQVFIKNLKKDILTFLNRIKNSSKNPRVTCESTGGYEDLLISLCLQQGVSVSHCNPVHIKHFIRSHGKHAKTDIIDAKYIAEYAKERNPEVIGNEWFAFKKRREVQQRIDYLVKENSARKSGLDKYSDKKIISEIKREIKATGLKIEKYRQQLAALIERDPSLKKLKEKLENVAGVGPVTSMTLLTTLPELGHANRGEIARLVGLAPLHFESGKYKGERKTFGGRPRPRTALYMAAVVASRHNPALKEFKNRLKEKGKAGRQIIIAIARKLLVHLNSIAKKEIFGI